MGNGEWRMENGEWRMENGEWRMGNGEWETSCARVKTFLFPRENLIDKIKTIIFVTRSTK